MSNEYRHVELLKGDVRGRRWTTEQKLTIIEQSSEPGETVSSTARCQGVDYGMARPSEDIEYDFLGRAGLLICAES
jgi:transposase